MEARNIIQKAIGQLESHTGIVMKWTAGGPKELDGKITFKTNSRKYNAYIEVKKELRNHQLPAILKQKENYHPLMVISEYIFPKIKEELRKQNIAYLETNGNIYFKVEDIFLWLEGQKPIPQETEKAGRAFTKTGLKLVFHFLLNEDLVNLTYREIAERTGIGFGNINVIVTDLKNQGFLVQENKNRYRLVNKKELLNKWMTAYQDKLKPALVLGTFRFLDEKDYIRWQQLPLKIGKTWWGGQPAGGMLTNYLKPAEFILYTEEKRNELIRNYFLVPDINGNVTVYQKFWQQDDKNSNVVPPLLTYVDLMSTTDRRCIETAQKVYNEFLQSKF